MRVCRGDRASSAALAPFRGHLGNRTNERSRFVRSDETFANRSLVSFAVVHACLLTLRTSQSCTLWLRYLQFKASHFASFSVTSQRSIYARCIRALESKREEATRAHEQDQRAMGVFIMVSSVLFFVRRPRCCRVLNCVEYRPISVYVTTIFNASL